MPYCDDCSKYWTPNSLNEDGTCPRCGANLEDPTYLEHPESPETAGDSEVDDEDDAKVPWHFKLMIVALVIYLGWRFIQLAINIFT